jgi:signal transduction histidine kinase
MSSVPLHEFVAVHREAIIARCRAKAAIRSAASPAEPATNHGVPLFLDQLIHALCFRPESNREIGRSAGMHGHDLLVQGFSIAQVVKDYGDVCQSISDLAMEMDAAISTEDFRRLNCCLDDAIAAAVTEYGVEANQSTLEGATASASERLGVFAHEVGNLAQTAILAFEVLKSGSVGAAGSTAAVLGRSLVGIQSLIACACAEVRLANDVQNRERFLVAEFIADLEPAARLEADARRVTLTVPRVEQGLVILADRQVLAAAVGNLLQNAFKFTRPRTTVTLRVQGSAERVLIEVLDECGGLPDGNINDLFRAFEQRSADRTGLGLGLAFSRRGVEANDGRICAHNLPHHQGCVFSIDLPRLPVRDPGMIH